MIWGSKAVKECDWCVLSTNNAVAWEKRFEFGGHAKKSPSAQLKTCRTIRMESRRDSSDSHLRKETLTPINELQTLR